MIYSKKRGSVVNDAVQCHIRIANERKLITNTTTIVIQWARIIVVADDIVILTRLNENLKRAVINVEETTTQKNL